MMGFYLAANGTVQVPYASVYSSEITIRVVAAAPVHVLVLDSDNFIKFQRGDAIYSFYAQSPNSLYHEFNVTIRTGINWHLVIQNPGSLPVRVQYDVIPVPEGPTGPTGPTGSYYRHSR